MDKKESIKILKYCIEKIRNSSDAEKEEMIRVYEKYDKDDYKHNDSDVEIVLYGKFGRYFGLSSQVENTDLIDKTSFESVYCSINIRDINLEMNKAKKYETNKEENSSMDSYGRNYGGNRWNLLAS